MVLSTEQWNDLYYSVWCQLKRSLTNEEIESLFDTIEFQSKEIDKLEKACEIYQEFAKNHMPIIENKNEAIDSQINEISILKRQVDAYRQELSNIVVNPNKENLKNAEKVLNLKWQ